MLKFVTHTECGGGHADNEDYLLREQHGSGGHRFLCFVADGQGGRADGALAAKIACEAAMKVSRNLPWDELTRQTTWDEIFSSADRKVQASCNGFTTLTGFAIDENMVTGGSVGDSKAYFHDESNVFVELTERQQKNPPIGGHCNSAYVFHLPKFKGTLLVVTDGVWKYAGYDTLRDAASGSIKQVIDSLREATISRQGKSLPDDFTILAVTNIENNAPQSATAP